MQNEWNGKIIEEFFGLRAKMYSLKSKKEKLKNGVTKNVVKKTLGIKAM